MERTTKPCTYDLRGNGGDSDRFYGELRAFAERFLLETPEATGREVDAYREWIGYGRQEPLRGRGEYLFDLLMVGVLFDRYERDAAQLPSPAAEFLAALYSLRSRNEAVKGLVDPLRGVLATLLLRDRWGDNDQTRRSKESQRLWPRSGSKLRALERWARATGDLDSEAKRVALLLQYVCELSPRRTAALCSAIDELKERFLREAQPLFGPYLAWVQPHRSKRARNKRWKEDYFLTTRHEVEYALSLFGAELMNRDMRMEFLNVRRKTVLLPACMRRDPQLCRGRHRRGHILCTGCDIACPVDRVRQQGKEAGFTVRVIPHSSQATRWLRSWAKDEEVGVVGVACPLHLLGGGLELRQQKIRAQCVFLDNCGCKAHWHPEGLPTDLNAAELGRIVSQQ